jgi:membrane protease YdiL (CAAX protease family)
LCETRPLLSAILLWLTDVSVAVVIYSVSVVLIQSHWAIGWLSASLFRIGFVVVLAGILGQWTLIGINTANQWRPFHGLWVYFVIIMSPSLVGVTHLEQWQIPIIVVGNTLSGLGQEGMYRGLMIYILQHMGGKPAILLSSVLFGLAHWTPLLSGATVGYTLLGIWYALCIGFAFAVIRLRTNTIWLVALLHALLNIILTFQAWPQRFVIEITIAYSLLWAACGLITYLRYMQSCIKK